MRRIFFNLDWQWYDLIRRGEKVVEYREIKPHWTVRLRNTLGGRLPTPNKVAVFPTNLVAVFRNGYGRPSQHDSSTPDIVRRVNYVDIGPCPYEGWGGNYYRIHFEKDDAE